MTIQRIVQEVVVLGGELHQQHGGDRRLALGHGLDLLRDTIFKDLEVFLGDVGRQARGAGRLSSQRERQP